MQRLLLAVALTACGNVGAQQPPVMLVLDASGSMWGQIDGVSKVEIARDAVDRLLGAWNPQTPLGLVAYGHRRTGDCADIERLIDAAPLDAARFEATVRGLNAKGMTPLSAAVIDAAEALRSSEQKATVILVSDGEETCKLDPCAVGRDLEAKGKEFTAHVIGFDVPNPQHQAQLRCLAENTGGRYFSARNAEELAGSLSLLAAAATEPPLPPASATLDAPATVSAASTLAVAFDGPADRGDYIAIVDAADGKRHERDYVLVEAGKRRVELASPASPGRFELQYVSPRRSEQVLASRPLDVTDVAATLQAPDSVGAGETVEVTASGPLSRQHWIGFAPKGSAPDQYLDFERPTGASSTLTLQAPTEPGEYELRYVLNEYERVLASRPITVGAASASVRGPREAELGGTITVQASGPVGSGTWVGFAPAGSDADAYLSYRDLEAAGGSYTLDVPTEAGEYELRVVMANPSTVIASQPITVTPASARIDGPATASVGAQVTVTAQGPQAPGSWVGFAPAGSDDAEYLDFRYVEAGQHEYTLTAPDEPGDYELRYVLRESTVLARQPIRVD